MDKYDEIESKCGHSGCTALKRVTERLFDMAEGGDSRFRELLLDLAAENNDHGNVEMALAEACEHVVEMAVQSAMEDGQTEGLQVLPLTPKMLQDIGNMLRREGVVQEALIGAKRGESQNN